MNAEGERIISRREFAEITGKSVTTLKRWDRREIGPRVVRFPSGRVGYRLRDVEAWIDACTKRPAPPPPHSPAAGGAER